MKVLITGASGFVGRNLVENLRNFQLGKNPTRALAIDEVFQYDRDSDPEELESYCAEAEFVFHLAGVNRPQDSAEFTRDNCGFTERLFNLLKKNGNKCPVMFSSSIQATLAGRFQDSEYGKSKRVGEELAFRYSRETGAKVLVYRFPNLFGKWCRPDYNSFIATFCYNLSRGLPIRVDDPATEITLLYIDDLLEAMYDALEGKELYCDFVNGQRVPSEKGKFAYASAEHHTTVGWVLSLLKSFREQPRSLMIPEMERGTLESKLYATYLSYLPEKSICFPLEMKTDSRGSFTEILKTGSHGQVSVNISRPGITKGQHWHNSKWEIFVVVSGHGLIRERKIGEEGVVSFEVSGEKLEAVQMLPGYAHEIVNLSDTEPLVTLIWANELMDSSRPDTFREMP